MKKLLVLTLVLGIASLASAGITLTVEDTAVAGVVSDNADAWAAFALISSPPGGVGALTPAGDKNASFNNDYGVQNSADFGLALGTVQMYFASAASTAPTDPLAPGLHYTITLPLAETQFLGLEDQGLGRVDLVLDDLATTVGTVYINEIPEPATMALLGLGGLLLRRKK